MKNAHDTLSLGELAAVLRTLCNERHTGTMFLSTDTNHSARIGIERGRIFSVAYGRHRGIEAVQQIQNIQYGKYSFAESVFNNAAEVPLPPTSELLAQLERAAVEGPFAGNEPFASPGRRDLAAAIPPRTTNPAPIRFPVPPADLDDGNRPLRLTGKRLYEAVTEALALSIGPVASVVCEDFREQLLAVTSPRLFRTIAAQIAAEVGSDHEGERFLARTLASVGLQHEPNPAGAH